MSEISLVNLPSGIFHFDRIRLSREKIIQKLSSSVLFSPPTISDQSSYSTTSITFLILFPFQRHGSEVVLPAAFRATHRSKKRKPVPPILSTG